MTEPKSIEVRVPAEMGTMHLHSEPYLTVKAAKAAAGQDASEGLASELWLPSRTAMEENLTVHRSGVKWRGKYYPMPRVVHLHDRGDICTEACLYLTAAEGDAR